MFSQSSECNINMPYEYLCSAPCGTQEGYGTSPFYATMGQPLVYYCQMPQQKFKQRSENVRNENRNCFSKAFHWYTKEHVPQRDEPAKTIGDVNGFANWLDNKYDQYLQDQCDSGCYKVKYTSITEVCRILNEPCETRRKKFRVKRCSLHYIMQPKDISRPASENNDMSKAMLMSSEVVLSRYSHSCTSLRVLCEPSVVVPKKSQEMNQSLNSIEPNKEAPKSSKMSPGKAKDVECLCSKVTKKNAYTQSDPLPTKSLSKTVPKAETDCQTEPKSESLFQPEQKVTSCQCGPLNLPKISHPTKIEIEFEGKPILTHMESTKLQSSKDFVPKADAQCQSVPTDVKTCLCGSNHSIPQEKSQIMQKKVRLEPCNCNYMNFVKCPFETPLANSNQNKPILCNQCIPCKATTVLTDGAQISNGFNKTTAGSNGLAPNSENKKTNCFDGKPAANPTTTNDGVQTSNQTTIASECVQTSNHSIRIDKDGAVAGYPLFMKIVFADKLCKF